MLTNAQLTLAKTQPREFLLQSKDLTTRIKKILLELKFEEETMPSEEKMQNLLAEAKNAKAEREEIYNLIDKAPINDTYKYILISHFLNGKTLLEISHELNYTYRWVMRLQAKALKSFSNSI